MNKKFLILPALAASLFACAQQGKKPAASTIDVNEVRRVETALASDEMRGRRAGTPDIDRAADYIAAEFKKAGLQPVKGNTYLQEFSMVKASPKSMKVELDGQVWEPGEVVLLSTQKEVKIDEGSGYPVQYIKAGENYRQRVQALLREEESMVVLVDTSFAKNFSRLNGLRGQQFPSSTNVLFLLGTTMPAKFSVKAEQTIDEVKYRNVVGILPGKSRKNEYVIFSGHYDHLGVAKAPQNGDSIFNGANDDAAGTTAVILLAQHYAKQKNNERTLVFAAFTAEEVGGFGSQYFSKQYDPAQVMAMFNIEMIGTESKWGKNSAYITGFEKTNMGEILQRNLEGTGFAFHPDPYTTQQLFYRSDNATLARLGVPAHTISTSKMDTEPNYHKLSDEVGTLDLENMAEIIRSIALSAQSIISGKDTPTRVKVEDLR